MSQRGAFAKIFEATGPKICPSGTKLWTFHWIHLCKARAGVLRARFEFSGISCAPQGIVIFIQQGGGTLGFFFSVFFGLSRLPVSSSAGRFPDVSWIITCPEYFRSISRVFPEHFLSVSWVFPEHFPKVPLRISWAFPGCFLAISLVAARAIALRIS